MPVPGLDSADCRGHDHRDGCTGPPGLVRERANCYIRAVARLLRGAFTPHAVVAELVDALA